MSVDSDVVVLGAAMGWDLCLGEPPLKLHPVVWLGGLISVIERSAPRAGKAVQFLWGLCVALALPGLAGFATFWLLHALAPGSLLFYVFATFLLTSSFSLRMLGASGMTVAAGLRSVPSLDEARARVAMICSRDTRSLSKDEIVATTVESLAENASDSFVAPLFWFALLGIPGAVAYRVANTLDARLGYRDRREFLGKAAARLDDLWNFLPARLTALLFLAVGRLHGLDARHALRIAMRDARNTPSPNGGAPMATMAGLLRVRLTKPGVYELGDPERELDADCIQRAWRIVFSAAWLAFLLTLGALALRHAV